MLNPISLARQIFMRNPIAAHIRKIGNNWIEYMTPRTKLVKLLQYWIH